MIDDKISYLTLEDVLSLAVIAVDGEPLVRDLGLLVGVNDAEAMKHLKPRFNSVPVDQYDLD